jgi:signal transduction histidine kinase
MVLQAGAARLSLHRNPEAREAVASVERTGRSAMSEMDRLLDLLDDVGGEGDAHLASRQPPLGLEDLPQLVDSVRRTGLRVDLNLPGGLPARSSSLDQSSYRIIQEALTNTLKHARATCVEVTVAVAAGNLELSVSDNGIPRAAVSAGSLSRPSRGIIGMRERAVLFGGEIDAGPAAEGGWVVRAVLPLQEQPRA